MSDFNVTDCFSINPETTYTFIDNEAVLLSILDQTLYGINEIGTIILKQLAEQPISLQMVSDYLMQQFEVDEARCIADTQLFFKAMLAQNFIIPVR